MSPTATTVDLQDGAGKVVWFVDRNPLSARFGLTVVVAAVRPGRFQLVIDDQRRIARKDSLFQSLAAPGDLLVISGGFYCCRGWDPSKYVPLGYVIKDGVLLSDRAHFRTGGVFWVDSDSVYRVTPIREFVDPEPALTAIQSTPIVLSGGKVDVGNGDPARFDRVALGLSRDGGLVVAGAFRSDGQALSMFEFAVILEEFAAREHLDDMLALDGGPSAYIYLPSIGKRFGTPSRTYIPNVLRIRAKAPS